MHQTEGLKWTAGGKGTGRERTGAGPFPYRGHFSTNDELRGVSCFLPPHCSAIHSSQPWCQGVGDGGSGWFWPACPLLTTCLLGYYNNFYVLTWLGHGAQILVKYYSGCFCECALDEINI